MMKGSHSSSKPAPARRENLLGSKVSRLSKPATPDNQPEPKSGDPSGKPTFKEMEPVRLSDIPSANPPKQRSRSTVSDRQPWGHLLNKHMNEDNQTVFGKLDPLRTLHFLARELQTHMQARLPEETSLQEIIKAMHSALKRIPPEVASTVQLQQQKSKDSIQDDVQTTTKSLRSKELNEFQKLIEGSTMKLEASCKQLETMCGQLRDEKLTLETMLQQERTGALMLQRRIEDVEDTNKKLSQNISKKEEELCEIKGVVEDLKAKLKATNPDLQLTVSELKKSKLQLERDNQKLEHQLRLCAIEKEKYLAILAVRDRQIYEIRSEMTQLQESVNEQLVELHNYASNAIPLDFEVRKEKIFKSIEDQNGSIWNKEEDYKQNHLFKGSDREDT